MNNVLVVGGAGYIGGFLTDHLNRNDYNVAVYDNLLFEDRYLKNCEFIYGDIRDTKKLSKIVDNYDCVVWLTS